jgi:hypothetical protein
MGNNGGYASGGGNGMMGGGSMAAMGQGGLGVSYYGGPSMMGGSVMGSPNGASGYRCVVLASCVRLTSLIPSPFAAV